MIEPHILNLPTPRLLAYFKKHLRNRYGRIDYYLYSGEIDQAYHDEFMADYNAVKEELDRREHVEQ